MDQSKYFKIQFQNFFIKQILKLWSRYWKGHFEPGKTDVEFATPRHILVKLLSLKENKDDFGPPGKMIKSFIVLKNQVGYKPFYINIQRGETI